MTERICNVPKCKRPHSGKGMCNLHYQRTICGKPLDQEPRPVYDTCTVDDCAKPTRSKHAKMCAMHYHRVYRYGSVNPKHEPKYTDITGYRFDLLIVVERNTDGTWLCRCDCGRTNSFRYGSLNRGDAHTCGHKPTHYRNVESYTATHARLRSDRGPASRYACVDCGKQARHWSYEHTDHDEQRDWTVKGAPWFSTKAEHYSPRCVSCHKVLDLEVSRARGMVYR